MNHQAPDFIIVGAQKAGTTSLYNCLKQHPAVVPASKKEIHYFSRNYNKDLAWYLDHFPKRTEQQVSGEASPFYLFHPQSAARIAKALPQVKIIIILRDPVERAISHYHQQYRRGHETLPMQEAFDKEPDRINAAWKKLVNNEQISGAALQKFSYLKRGEYLEQLLRYEKHFPSSQLFILESQQFFDEPKAALARTYEFLGIDSGFMPSDLWPRKPGGYGDAPPETIDFLRSYYAPYNQALFEHLGQNYDWQ